VGNDDDAQQQRDGERKKFYDKYITHSIIFDNILELCYRINYCGWRV